MKTKNEFYFLIQITLKGVQLWEIIIFYILS